MTTVLPPASSLVEGFIAAIRAGDAEAVRAALAAHPEFAAAYFGDEAEARTALHVATDWPGGSPNVADIVAALVQAGADVDAPFVGDHGERPLHWAASSDDIAAARALLAAGADVSASGGVLTGGPPLDNAVIFRCWSVADLLVEAGATVQLWHAAALGDAARVRSLVTDASRPAADNALWHASRNGRTEAARILLSVGADAHAVGHEDTTPIEVARQSGHADLAASLEAGTT